MSKKHVYEPVLHCDGRYPNKVISLSNKLMGGVYYNTGIFEHPTVVKSVFLQAKLKLEKLNTEAKRNNDLMGERNTQCALVFEYIKQLLSYVKPICGNDIKKINKTGFDANYIRKAHPIFSKAVIKKVVKGIDPHTVKVMLAMLEGSEKHKKGGHTYIVCVFDSMETEEFRVGCIESDSRALIVDEVPFLIAQYYAVGIQNAAGKNELSAKVKFTLTD